MKKFTFAKLIAFLLVSAIFVFPLIYLGAYLIDNIKITWGVISLMVAYDLSDYFKKKIDEL